MIPVARRLLSRSCRVNLLRLGVRQSSTLPGNVHDQHLRAVFDDPQLWRSISSRQSTGQQHLQGLFCYPRVRKAEDLPQVAADTLAQARIVVNRICALPQLFTSESFSPAQALLATAKQFDRLSDLLCAVIDLCEFIRNVHTEPDWIQQANEAYELLCSYMNELNTHVGLYQILKDVLGHFPTEGRGIDSDLYAAYQVSAQFLRDFEKSGIHLPDRERQQFVELSDAAIYLGRQFTHPSDASETDPVVLSKEEVGPIDKRLLEATSGSGKYTLWPDTHEAHHVLRNHPSEKVRQRIWKAQNTGSPRQIQVLEDLLAVRAQIALLVGKGSFAETTLSDKMARDPECVKTFLHNLASQNAPFVEAELATISPSKEVAPWNRDYLTSHHMASLAPTFAKLSPYFSIGTVIQGLSRLFTSIFGVSFRFEEPAADELLWHPSVRKLVVHDEEQGQLGHIYCDLLAREGKPQGAAHYTVRCARRTDNDDAKGDELYADATLPAGCIEPGSDARRGFPGRWQLPTIVLSCDFQETGMGKVHLSWHETETLFHEVGHAIHSMLGQTEYQNVSGTRCATDFVELPSILMEHFCSSAGVLSLFARRSDDTPLPINLLRQHQMQLSAFSALEQSHQIVLSATDQAYHSSDVLDIGWNSTKTWYAVNNDFGPPGLAQALEQAGSSWQTRFGHLVGYSATYYSYLLDRAIAGQVWKQVFDGKALSRESGERYKKEVLSWGGGREPWECLAGLLENPRLADGGDKAMKTVGQWGITKVGAE